MKLTPSCHRRAMTLASSTWVTMILMPLALASFHQRDQLAMHFLVVELRRVRVVELHELHRDVFEHLRRVGAHAEMLDGDLGAQDRSMPWSARARLAHMVLDDDFTQFEHDLARLERARLDLVLASTRSADRPP